MKLQCGTTILDLDSPQVMGILNVTPDSFSDGGALHRAGAVDIDLALYKAEQLVNEGASLIDVGGESTRPGASPVAIDEELNRVIPVVEAIAQRLDVIISVDTSQPQVMSEAAAVGAGLINDVRALQLDGALAAAAAAELPVCIMHMKGNPKTMQHSPEYSDCVHEVSLFLHDRLDACIAAGIRLDSILVDPGIGFGKQDEHNLALVKNLKEFNGFGAGILFGVSRKSMIGRLLNRELEERLPGSLAFALLALQAGAKILRVHDVAATVDIIKVHTLVS